MEHVGLEFLQHVLVVHDQLLGAVPHGNVGQHAQGLLLDLKSNNFTSNCYSGLCAALYKVEIRPELNSKYSRYVLHNTHIVLLIS